MRLIILSHVLILLLLSNTLNAAELKTAHTLSVAQQSQLLKSIQPYAIVFGKGNKEQHIFIDPYCPHSQHFMQTLFQKKEKRFQESTYFFYLYQVNYTDAQEIIQTILHAQDRKKMLFDVMVADMLIMSEEYPQYDKETKAVADVAKALGVNRRPYIITIKK